MRRALAVALLCLLVLLHAAGCNRTPDYPQGETPPPPPPDAAPPVDAQPAPVETQPAPKPAATGMRIVLTPVGSIVSNSVVTAVGAEFSLNDYNALEMQFSWAHNGAPVSTTPPLSFDCFRMNCRRGDTLQGRARVDGNEVVSEVATIANAKPMLTGVNLIAPRPSLGEYYRVEVKAEDVDQDNIRIIYEWVLNNQVASTEDTLRVPLKKGDRFILTITPNDGIENGPSYTLMRDIKNFAPVMSGNLDFKIDDKNFFTYQASATDADGDNLTYALINSVDGMTINPTTGLVTWQIPPNTTGLRQVIVNATDPQGATAMVYINVRFPEAPQQKPVANTPAR